MSEIPDPGTRAGRLWWRDQSRRNLFFLCNQVLGYQDVCPEVHGPLVENLQRFKGGRDPAAAVTQDRNGMVAVGTMEELANYKPSLAIERLPGTRKTLNLVSRGFLKTSIATIAHSIQWIINYPDVRILISSGTDGQVKKFLSELKKHFQHGEMLRFLFPEFCPQGNVKEFGNQEEFTVPARKLHRKEPTVSTVTVGSVMAGGHYDVIKHDDVVDKENVRTVDQIAVVESHLQMTGPLLERYNITDGSDDAITGWTDYIGTRYHFSDAYGKIVESEEARKTRLGENYIPAYKILVMSALKEGVSVFDKKAVPLWPGRFPVSELRRIYEDPLEGGALFNSQYLLNPIPDGTGLIDDASQIAWMPYEKVIRPLYARMSLHVTVDLAGMEPAKGADNDYTVITLAGFAGGRMYVLEIIHGRPNPFEVINSLYDIYKRHPRIIDIKIEKENHARVLLPFLKNEQFKRGWLPIVELKRDNQVSKTNKIKALIPWFKTGRIRFSDEIACKDVLTQEILRFPKFHDDILDTIRDQLENADGGVISDVINMPPPPEDDPMPGSFMGFQPGGHPAFEGTMTPDYGFGGGVDPMTGL
jgi:predicted phage terminase large subunit-like protein